MNIKKIAFCSMLFLEINTLAKHVPTRTIHSLQQKIACMISYQKNLLKKHQEVRRNYVLQHLSKYFAINSPIANSKTKPNFEKSIENKPAQNHTKKDSSQTKI